MEQKEKLLITMAIFSISILGVNAFYTTPQAMAQLGFTVTALSGYTVPASNAPAMCEYISATEVWCSSGSGVKIINPTTQSITTTLYSGVSINDVDCTGSYCYSWHGGGTATANLTQWSISTHEIVNNRTFTMSGGGTLGRMIDAFNLQGAENVLLPSSSDSCIGIGGNTMKGLCVFNSDPTAWSSSRFIASGDTGNSAILYGIKFADTTEVFTANVMIWYQDGAGTRTLRILNLADQDSNFAGTQTCSASGFGIGSTAILDIYIYNDRWYFPFDNGATGLYLYTPFNSSTCGTTTGFVTTWDAPTSLTTDGEFWYVASYDQATSKSAMQVFNLTSSSSFTTYNITNTSGAGQRTLSGWYHSTEGELQILRGSNLVIFAVQAPDNPSGGNQVDGRCGNGTALDCVGDRSTINMITGAPSITNVTGSLLNGLGIIDTSDNPDPQTNGTGLILMLILGTFFATATIATIGVANSKFGAGISYTEIPKEFWLFLVVGAVSASWYLGWIPDIIFYALVIGLAGLFSFGLYKHVRGG